MRRKQENRKENSKIIPTFAKIIGRQQVHWEIKETFYGTENDALIGSYSECAYHGRSRMLHFIPAERIKINVGSVWLKQNASFHTRCLL